MEKNSRVDIVLDRYLKKNNISRSSLTRKTGLQYSQILRYCRNDIQKMDLNILGKLCDVLNCEITDILELKSK